MRNLKNTVRKKLVETQRQKNKRVLQEQRIVTSRFAILAEGNQLKTKRDVMRLADKVIMEITYLNSQDFDGEIIQEGLFDFLGGLFDKGVGGVWKYFQERFANYILSHMGLPDGFLKDAISIWFADTPFSEMSKMFTDCNYFVRSLSSTLIEAYAQKLAKENLGDNMFYDTLRNALKDQLESGKMDDVFYNTLSSVICPLLKGMAPKMADIQNAMKGGAMGAVSPSTSTSTSAASGSASNSGSSGGGIFSGLGGLFGS